MNVLYISNGFADSTVHSELCKAMDADQVSQTIYCPIREERLMHVNQFNGERTKFVYSYCIKSWYKFFYHYKMHALFSDLLRKIDLCAFDIIYATSLFSDGGLALKVSKKSRIPYVVAIRNTDINLYIKRLPHTHRRGKEILKKASAIVFISKSEMEEFSNTEFVRPILSEIKNKFIFQPNGVNSFWHKNITHSVRKGRDVLYIGNYTPDKNIIRLAEAVIQLNKEDGFKDARLIIVGGEKEGKAWKSDSRIYEIINAYPKEIKALGKIYDRDKLLEVMRSCAIFAMPSIHETFGLVYIEALSQNLPVIYSKGQGIDGIFNKSVGVSVNPLSVPSIRDAIKQVMMNYGDYSNKDVEFSMFDWDNISKNYVKLFESIISRHLAL